MRRRRAKKALRWWWNLRRMRAREDNSGWRWKTAGGEFARKSWTKSLIHFSQRKMKERDWDWRLCIAWSRHTKELFRQAIVKVVVRDLKFGYEAENVKTGKRESVKPRATEWN